MMEYIFDIVEMVTYSATVKANSLKEAEDMARNEYFNKELDVIDTGLALIELMDEKEVEE